MALYSFDRYPYSNAHELNLDWLLEEMKKLGYQMDNFVLLNTTKVANPITWDVTKTYERLTIVTYSDADGYRAYLSIADVPAGIAITNTLYWAPIGTIIDSSIISDLEARITEDLQELSDDVDARLAAQKTLLEGEIAAVEDKLPVLNHNRITYYIDANAGNDENDGLTEATAFKTFDRFMEQADKYQALHARIISAGNYSYSYYEIANIDLDIQATTGGCCR